MTYSDPTCDCDWCERQRLWEADEEEAFNEWQDMIAIGEQAGPVTIVSFRNEWSEFFVNEWPTRDHLCPKCRDLRATCECA